MRHICWRFYDTIAVHKFQLFRRKRGDIRMLAQWLGDFVGEMHLHKVTKTQLANELGFTREYVSQILNGHKNPENIEQRFNIALQAIIDRKE